MDWKTASSYYEARLSDALNVCRHADNLAMLPQAEVPAKLKEILLQEAEPARRQRERLRKREFRIAVVGLEKSGKSTFINAWLECDLLPAKAARCTFTTTQIYSVTNDTEQRLEVQAKTDEQFLSLIEYLKEIKAQEDINTIKQHEATLHQVRRDGNLTFPFTRLEDIREQLRKYVADERYAHAVLEARLYTSKLAQAEGVVFYDVPGLDSGLAKHVDEAQQMLSDCDAVILVQRFTSLREKELEIIKFTELGDKNVTVADKLFVFLSRIDSQATPEALKQHLEEAAQDWLKRANLPHKRIVSGSAGAYLVLNGLAEKQTQLEIGEINAIQDKLRTLTGIEDQEALSKEGTGIPEIKERIFHYINTERVSILRKRCEASIAKILDTSEEICKLTRKSYPENPEDAKRVEEERQRILFTEWWRHKWETIKADLQNFYDSSVVNKDTHNSTTNSSSSIEKFRERYFQVIANEIQKLREEAFSKKDRIFAANSNPVFDRTNANFRWREDLYIDVSKTLSLISSQLALELQAEALKLVEYMTDLLWGSKQVKERLIENYDDYFLLKLENSLSILFLRFARPVAEALIRGPVKSDTRKEIIRSLGVDIEIVDNYYAGEESAFRVLKRYVKYGPELLFNPELRQKVLGVTGVARQVVIDPDKSLETPQEKVVFEVENDIKAFEEYLRYAIFDAAGFESYCIQELRGLVDSFREKEGTWAGVALNEWLQGNSSLLSEVPSSLRSQESNLEVSERLRQLSVALKKARSNGFEEE
ncbi:MAG: Dynamin family protein [Symploca sp. SIO2G7]|nr:Dynamin family protein [Symploca sp. SIO2G7]